MTDVASLGVWPLGDLPGVCVRCTLPLLGPVALAFRADSKEPITPILIAY